MCSTQHDRKCRLKSIYFNHPSQGNSTNYYLILGPRDKAAPPTSQKKKKKIPPKRVKNLATPSSIFIFSSSTGELCSQPIRGNVCRTGWMFPEYVEWSFLDPKYSFVTVWWIPPTRSAKQKFAQLRTRFAEYSQLGSWTNIHPIKNGLEAFAFFLKKFFFSIKTMSSQLYLQRALPGNIHF